MFICTSRKGKKILVYIKFTAELCVSSCINPATSCVAVVSPVKKCTDNLHALLKLLLLLFPKHTNIYTGFETHIKKKRHTLKYLTAGCLKNDDNKQASHHVFLHPVFMHAAIVNAFNGFCQKNEKKTFFF